MPLVPIERVRFATDTSMATITNTSTSQFRAALMALIQSVAAGIIASDPTVVAAAEAAVDEALQGANVARRPDPAYPWTTLGSPIVYFRDRNGYATFLEARGSDGAPTPTSGALIARTLTELGFDLTGGGGESPVTASGGPAGPIVCAGDSLTANDNWLGTLAQDAFVDTIDLGQAGQSTTEIAFRLGALPVQMTVEGDQIPASGAVDVTSLSPSSTWRFTSVQWKVKGWLAGVFGTFWFRSSAQPVARFVREKAGTVEPCPAGTAFIVAPDVENRSGVGFERLPLIYWGGRNNISDSAGIQRDFTAIWGKFKGRRMVMSVTNGTNEPSGTSAYATIQSINSWYEQQAGAAYWDARSWLIHEAIYKMGITPTAADLANMSKDCPPPSIMNNGDAIHFSPECSTVFGHEVAFQMRKRGL